MVFIDLLCTKRQKSRNVDEYDGNVDEYDGNVDEYDVTRSCYYDHERNAFVVKKCPI